MPGHVAWWLRRRLTAGDHRKNADFIPDMGGAFWAGGDETNSCPRATSDRQANLSPFRTCRSQVIGPSTRDDKTFADLIVGQADRQLNHDPNSVSHMLLWKPGIWTTGSIVRRLPHQLTRIPTELLLPRSGSVVVPGSTRAASPHRSMAIMWPRLTRRPKSDRWKRCCCFTRMGPFRYRDPAQNACGAGDNEYIAFGLDTFQQRTLLYHSVPRISTV